MRTFFAALSGNCKENKYICIRLFALVLTVFVLFPASCNDAVSGENNNTNSTDGESVTIDFYAVNDLHGKVVDSNSQPGVDEFTTYIKNARTNDDHVILLSSGDMWQGASESNLTYGNIVTDWMNELDFVSMTLGNHEFDWGSEYIMQNLELAEFPFLAINIFDSETDQLVDYCTPSLTVECGEVTVGIIGAIGDTYSSISSDKTEDIYFKSGKDLTALVKAESQKLRSAGADVIVYTLHDGLSGNGLSSPSVSDKDLAEYYDISLSDGYVDLVFEGHSHKYYVKQDSRGIYHLQGGGDNDGITHVEITVSPDSRNCTVTLAEYIPTHKYSSLSGDGVIDDLLKKYEDQIAKAYRVIGNNSRLRSGDELRTLVAELYYRKGCELWGKDYEIVLGGGYLSVRSPYDLEAGEVKYSDLQNIFPFDNRLDLCSVKGSNLRSRFFESNNTNYFIYYGEYGASVKQNIDPNATYYIITDSYSSTYAPNRLTVVESLDENIFARDLLAEYIKSGEME